MADQCALGTSGTLLDASDIPFYESESDEKALPAVSSGVSPFFITYILWNNVCISELPQRRSTRKRQTDRMTQYLAAEKADDDGQPPAPRVPRARATGATRTKFIPESVSDEEDEDFDDLPDLEEVSHSSDEGSDSESDFDMVDNEEVSPISAPPIRTHCVWLARRSFVFKDCPSAWWGGLVEAPNPLQVLRHQAQGQRVR
jgi:hypothetical protein